MNLVKRMMCVAFTVVAVLGLMVSQGSTAQAVDWNRPSSLYSNNGSWIPVRDCPTTNCQPKGWVKPGTKFYMDCYQDFQWATGNYSSNRWFYGYNGYWGYVHSSYVANQISVRRC